MIDIKKLRELNPFNDTDELEFNQFINDLINKMEALQNRIIILEQRPFVKNNQSKRYKF